MALNRWKFNDNPFTGNLDPKALYFDFTRGALDPRVAFTRANTATRVNASGNIEVVAADTPRFDHDPATLEPLGILMEDGIVNECIRSDNFANNAWGNVSSSVTSNVTTGPDGTVSADKFVEDAALGRPQVVTPDSNYSTAVTYTVSVYAKAAERSLFGIANQSFADLGNAWVFAQFDLSNGTVGNTGSNPQASIQDAGNGWYRCSIKLTPSGTASAKLARFYLSDGTIGLTPEYNGDGTSGVYLYGAQIEESPLISSYIPTTANPVTRSSDRLFLDGTAFTDFYNFAEGTAFAEVQSNEATVASSGEGRIFNFARIAAQNEDWVATRFLAGTGIDAVVYKDNISQVDTATLPAPSNDAYYKVALGYKDNSTQLCVDGTLGIEDTAGTMPTLVDRLSIGSTFSGSSINGHVKRFIYYPKKLRDFQLKQLTS